MKCELVHTPRGTVEVSTYGQGPHGYGVPVLFIHGGQGNCHETLFHKGFDPGRYYLITPSRPGYGHTPLLASTTPRSTADLFMALLDELDIDQVVVVGISAGGPAALELAAHYPGRVSALVLVSAVTKEWLTPDHPSYRKGKMLFSPALERYSWGLFRGLYSLFPRLMAKTMFAEFSSVKGATISMEEVAELYGVVSKLRSYSGFMNDLDQTIEAGTVAEVKVPTLILHSLNDAAVRVEHAYHAHKLIKDSRLYTYKNKWGHMLWLGPDSSNPILDVLAFLEKDYQWNVDPQTPIL
ncbi:alpha/beta fold hydrolase [Telluribacter sp. SYSU D00476]|uniref:alpha/beta fold hydrolase n=1 Tax=Telluribacter sp. SYSU D00476 TaxID=2811430 RepID=UPI001FF65FE1|nr:alpha/beta hydrolase [Telluribacter sp. SYSU D00476]